MNIGVCIYIYRIAGTYITRPGGLIQAVQGMNYTTGVISLLRIVFLSIADVIR